MNDSKLLTLRGYCVEKISHGQKYLREYHEWYRVVIRKWNRQIQHATHVRTPEITLVK